MSRRGIFQKRAIKKEEPKTLFLLQLYEGPNGLKIRYKFDSSGVINAAKIGFVEVAARIFAKSIGAEIEE